MTRGSPARLSTGVRSRMLDVARAMPGVIEPIPEVLRAQIHLDNLRRLRVVATVAGPVSLLHLAAYDPLTGVLNRRQFELPFDQEIARHLRTGEPCSLVLFDLDHCKAVNDAYGHPVGDALLHTIAEVVTGRLRASDLLARWGGEEFLALLPATDRDGAVAVAETLRAHVGSVDFEVGVGEPLSMTISLGVAEVAPAHPEALADAYRRADAALYDAKRRGRDRVGVDAGSSADPPGG